MIFVACYFFHCFEFLRRLILLSLRRTLLLKRFDHVHVVIRTDLDRAAKELRKSVKTFFLLYARRPHAQRYIYKHIDILSPFLFLFH